MATPLFLLPLDGDTTYQDTGAGGTATITGTVSWVDGHVPGMQAIYVQSASNVQSGAIPGSSTMHGSMVARSRKALPGNPTSFPFEAMSADGSFDTEFYTSLHEGVFMHGHVYSNETPPPYINLQIASTILGDLDWHFWYLEWSPTHFGLQIDDEPLQIITHAQRNTVEQELAVVLWDNQTESAFLFADTLGPEERHALRVSDVWTFDQFDPTPAWTEPVVTALAFATPQDVLNASYTETRHTVYIGGVMTAVDQYSTHHSAGRMSTATISIPLPAGDHIQPNAEVEIWDGHNNLMGIRFWGRLPAWNKAMVQRGNILTIKPVGWSSLLVYGERFDLTFNGPITISAIFDSLCARRGVPNYRADTILDDTGTIEVTLGNNPYIEDGTVVIPASQSLLEWLNDKAGEYGYYVYDDNLGTVRLARISGAPVDAPVADFAESIGLIEADQDYDISEIVNYWEVQGPEYEDDIGRSVPIRAIPASITSDPLIPVNDGVNYRQYRSGGVTTQQNAEIVRRRLEIDNSEPQEPIRWSSVAIPNITPGDTISITSTTLGVTQNFWLMSVDVSNDGNGLIATYEGWRGGGVALPAGVDRIVIPVYAGAIHLGDETVPWYTNPSPLAPVYVDGDPIYEKTWDFTIPKRATAVNVLFRVHGSNSQFIGGVNEGISVSKFELWKLPIIDPEEDRPHASGTLPVLDENYAQRYHYATDDTKWSPGAIALRGFDEEEVDVRLKLIAGKNSEATLGPIDDFEVKGIEVEVYGTVEPVIVPSEVST